LSTKISDCFVLYIVIDYYFALPFLALRISLDFLVIVLLDVAQKLTIELFNSSTYSGMDSMKDPFYFSKAFSSTGSNFGAKSLIELSKKAICWGFYMTLLSRIVVVLILFVLSNDY
jgi:hypothetical protein